ncbi:high-affinity choline transporter 1-like [Babylonia areolata]|uniref:high-affinity choline transporter 1-like n=1 Tax=Babylonia areolata TaxID=304850 RepID=UPI003FD0AD9C
MSADSVSVEGILTLGLFYLLVLVTGLVASWYFRKRHANDNTMETTLVAGRSLKGVVSVFTMMATTVGGGYINGTAESVATNGLVWTLAPLGIFLGLNMGGIIFARPMRERRYVTMLDPIQKAFGRVPTVLVYLASLFGDVLWTAAILSALGSSLSTIAGIPIQASILLSSAVTVTYTLVGSMVAVAYTDVLQLLLIAGGLGVSLPFVMTNENANVVSIGGDPARWVGTLQWNESMYTWVDLLLAMSLGSIPWQAYFQRVLSVQQPSQAVLLSVVGGFGAVLFAVPSVLIGAIAVSANWTDTGLGRSPLPPNGTEASLVLPLVLKEFTPRSVSILGLGAISAAVMSSMDSAILGSGAMFTHNIYRRLFRPKAETRHLMVTQRLSIVLVGFIATAISLSVSAIYGIFILAADIVYVIILPQLTYALFLGHRGDGFGAVVGFVVGATMRFGAGEPTIGLPPFILYSAWDPHFGQSFPFRTTAMLCSGVSIAVVSEVVGVLRARGLWPRGWCDAGDACVGEEGGARARTREDGGGGGGVGGVRLGGEVPGEERVRTEQETALLNGGGVVVPLPPGEGLGDTEPEVTEQETALLNGGVSVRN